MKVRSTCQPVPGAPSAPLTFEPSGAMGYQLLAAANVPVVPKSSSSGAGILLVGLGIAAVLLLAAALIWRSDRRRREE